MTHVDNDDNDEVLRLHAELAALRGAYGALTDKYAAVDATRATMDGHGDSAVHYLQHVNDCYAQHLAALRDDHARLQQRCTHTTHTQRTLQRALDDERAQRAALERELAELRALLSCAQSDANARVSRDVVADEVSSAPVAHVDATPPRERHDVRTTHRRGRDDRTCSSPATCAAALFADAHRCAVDAAAALHAEVLAMCRAMRTLVCRDAYDDDALDADAQRVVRALQLTARSGDDSHAREHVLAPIDVGFDPFA